MRYAIKRLFGEEFNNLLFLNLLVTLLCIPVITIGPALLALTEDGERLRQTVLADRKREADEFFSVLEPGDRAELARILGELTPHGGS